MGDPLAKQRNGHDFSGNQASAQARQQNGDQVYSNVRSVHHGDAYYNGQADPTVVPRSGYLSPQRWLDEPKNNAALREAARYGQLQRIAHLLRQPDKDVDSLDANGLAPLHYAVQTGRLEAARMLLHQGGADPGLQRPDKTSPTPLILAARDGDVELGELLLAAGAPVDCWSRPDLSSTQPLNVLGEAILGGHLDFVIMLLEHGLDPNAALEHIAYIDHMKPLMLAMLIGRADIVRLLLFRGASLQSTFKFPFKESAALSKVKPFAGKTAGTHWLLSPIIWALLHDDCAEMLRLLLEQSISATLLPGAFQCAALISNIEAMSVLLRAGVPIDLEYRDRTALHVASYFGETRAVLYLLEQGADVNRKDFMTESSNEEYTAMFPSRVRSRPFIEDRCCWRTSVQFGLGTFTRTIEMPVVLTSASWPPYSIGQPLHYAVGHPETMKVLLDSGATITSLDPRTGYSPLHIAAKQLELESAEYLLRCGASILSLARGDLTPFDLANAQTASDSLERTRKWKLLDLLRNISGVGHINSLVLYGPENGSNLL
ncbi:Ankyrin-1 [Pseudocercospora fuligena]|uniref:Ankyrin-1 n=1 Tax=Pseudocercospora fuligena TaxID=685502 RepID=A0A8H6RBI9_9PEZI|nr:Ankyrin-1 [Pseudocercospora fuligena]